MQVGTPKPIDAPLFKGNVTESQAKVLPQDSDAGTPIEDKVEVSSTKQKKGKPVRHEISESVKPEASLEPKPGIDLKDVKPMEKQLFEVDSTGKTTVRKTFVYDAANNWLLDNLALVGSWDKNTGRYTNEWKDSAVPMEMDKKGRWIADLELVDDGQKHNWEWGVTADSPIGKDKWAIFEEGNLAFDLHNGKAVEEYTPTTYHRMGATRDGEDVNFKFWAPHAKNVKAVIWGDENEVLKEVPLDKDPRTSMWTGGLEDGWKDVEGKNYAYLIITSEDELNVRADPYARFLQGPQRGIGEVYVHPENGMEVHKYYKDSHMEDQGKPSWKRMARFEIQNQENAEAAYLKLFDQNGNQMNKAQILEKLGGDDTSLISKYHKGKLNDHWLENVEDSGRIKMVNQGGAWATIVNNPDGLVGLGYRFEVMEKGPGGKTRLVGDVNNDGALSEQEAKATHFNDPYSPTIIKEIGWPRYGVIQEPKFDWQNDNTPRMTTDKNKMIIYQLHVGSVFGDAGNVKRSTFKDVIDRLEYFKDMGVNTLEILPDNTFEGQRDWGYIGTSSLAKAEQYGFQDESGKWVSGTEAVKKFVDTAHGLGFNVVNDVVYNHWGGDQNQLWKHDGDKNPYFDWEEKPEGSSKSVKNTDWGAMPALNKEPVRQLIVDSAMAQLDEFHYDGLRFDFTHPIHAGGWGGGDEGWSLLRKVNRQIHFFHPKATTAAEEFPNTPIIAQPSGTKMQGGAGFDHMWNTEFQHRLVHDNGNPGLLQQAAHGWRTDVDKFMNHMMHHPGFAEPLNSVTVITNHDEVGNADRTINTAMNHEQGRIPGQWERNAAKLTFGLGMLSPGLPIYFQGEESLATNQFKWGRPSTWDVGWDWKEVGKDWDWNKISMNDGKADYLRGVMNENDGALREKKLETMSDTDKKVLEFLESKAPEDREEAIFNVMRRQHNTFCAEATKLRAGNAAFDGDAEVHRVYSHNEDSVMAFTRKKGSEEFLVVGSFNHENKGDYNIPLSGGKWHLVFNSDAGMFGGNNYGSKIDVYGNQGSRFDIPKGGLLVYKKVE